MVKAKHWSQGLFFIGLAFLIAALTTTPSCGGGGGGGGAGASTPQSPTAEHRIHVSTTSGAVAVPASSSLFIVRSVTFTPTSANDVILYVQAVGTYSATTTGLTDRIILDILDAGSNSIGRLTEAPVTTGTGIPYRLQGSPGMDSTGVAASFPSSSYTIRLWMTTSATWSGSIESVTFRIVTAEGVTVVSPSSNITG